MSTGPVLGSLLWGLLAGLRPNPSYLFAPILEIIT